MRIKRASKTLSLFLAFCMVFTMLPTVAFAETDDMDSGVPLGVSSIITEFAPLDEDVAAQTVEIGTAEDALNLPDELIVTVQTKSTATDSDAQKEISETTVSVERWISEPAYDGDIEGVYIFTPTLELSEGVTVAESITPPTITVKVTAPDAPALRSEVGLMSTGSVTGTMDIDGQTGVGLNADTSGTGWTWTASTATLTLGSSYAGGYITFKCADTDTINLVCDSAVTVNKGVTYAIQSWGSLVIDGSGPLTLSSGVSASKDIVILGTMGNISGGSSSGIDAGGDVTIVGSVGEIAVITSSSGSGYGILALGGIHIINSVTVSSFNGAFNKAPTTLPSPSYTAIWSDNSDGSGSSAGSAYVWNASHKYVKIEKDSGTSTPTVSGFRAERNGANNVKFYFTPSITGKYGYDISKKGGAAFSPQLYYNINSVGEFVIDETIDGISAADILVIYLKIADENDVESELYSLEVPAYTALTDAQTPSISEQPTSATYVQNIVPTNLLVIANSTDGGSLSYQWYSNMTNSTVGGTPVTSSSTNGCTPSTSTVGTTYYYCVVTNTNNQATTNKTATVTSEIATVTVNPPGGTTPTITITKHPQNVTVTQGKINQTLTAEAVANNSKPVLYQWRQFVGGIGSDNTQPMLGETSNTFTIPTGLTPGTYQYLCVFNTDGTDYVDSNTAIVTVKPPSGGGDSGGGSDNGGSGGGSYTSPPATTPQQVPPNQPVTATTPVIATRGINGIANANIPASAISDVIIRAQTAARAQGSSANGISVELNVTMPQGATSLTVAIPQDALQSLVTAGVNQLTVNGAPVSLRLNQSALQAIQHQANGGITIGMTPATELSAPAQSMVGSRPIYSITISYINKDGKTQNITSFGSGTATLSIPYTPSRNEAVGYLFGVYVDGKGNTSRIPGSVYDANSRSILIPTNHLSVYGVGYTAPSAKFTDVANHWAKESIDYVVGRGLLSGTSETTFAPNTIMTRGMLVTALGRLAGVEAKTYTKDSFTDVKTDSPFRPYIEWAHSKGIVQGIGNNQFAADRAVTREEIAVIFANYAKTTEYKLPVARTVATFADASSIGSDYKDAVKAMQQAGIMMGEQNNKFNPKANATRAEVSSMIHRYIKLTIDPATAQGWAQGDDGQYMYYKDSKPLTGWQTIDGAKYFLGTDGTLKIGWVKDGDNWRHYTGNKVAVGWLDINNKCYYFTKDSLMVSGKWLQIDAKWYYFNADGSLAKNTKIDGYEVDENGVRKSK